MRPSMGRTNYTDRLPQTSVLNVLIFDILVSVWPGQCYKLHNISEIQCQEGTSSDGVQP